MAWVLFHVDPANNPRIFSKNGVPYYQANYYLLYDGTANAITAGFYDTLGGFNDIAYSFANPQNQGWMHWAHTYDGANQRLFLNGVNVATLADTTTPLTNANDLTIGGTSSASDNLDGHWDDARVYNFAWTEANIYALYADSRQGYNLTLNRMRMPLLNSVAAPGGLSIPIAAYHYNHHLGSMQS